MASTSDGNGVELSEMETAEGDSWLLVRGKRKLIETEIMNNLKSLSQKQLEEIVGISKKHQGDKGLTDTAADDRLSGESTTAISQSSTSNTADVIYTATQNFGSSTIQRFGHKNFSPTMQKIINKKFLNLFYFTPLSSNATRLQMAELWESVRTGNTDVILKTKKGFLLKTDTAKIIISNTLKQLQKNGLIESFKETAPYIDNSRSPKTPTESYSCVIASVELDISDADLQEHLKNSNFELRYCRRIISRATNQPTHFVRIITGHSKSYESLVNNGVFYKSRHYAVYTSAPPPPAPMPCGKCLQFTHKTSDCTAPIQCRKCRGNHPTSKCKSESPPKCTACGAEDHQAWAFQCPKRPTKPIDGVPNLPVKSLNKKSADISTDNKKKSRIHSPLTVHDVIVNTYVEKLNKPKNTNRSELLAKLKKKFISEYNVDTAVTFVGNNWVYILMFDLTQDEHISPTETLPGTNSSQVRVAT